MYTHRRKRQRTGRRGIETLEELCDYLITEEGKSYLLREDPSGVMLNVKFDSFAYAWALMPSKAKPFYVTLFSEMKTTLKVTIRKGLVDFKIALQNALKEVFGAVIIGCFFHWCQCLWRYAEGLGIAYPTMSTKDPEKYMVIKQLMALALLPEKLIEPTFLAFKEEVKEELGNHFDRMLDYIQNYWIKVRKPATFCCYEEFIRVNNAIETHHRDLNHILGHRRPPTWTYFISDSNEKYLRRAWEDVGRTNGDRLLPLHFLEQAANTLKRFNAPYEKEKLMIQEDDDAESTCSTDDETLSEMLEKVDEDIIFETHDNESTAVELEQAQQIGTDESHLIQSHTLAEDGPDEDSSERTSPNSALGLGEESSEDATVMDYSANWW
ncbi:hypothetical protein QAD02_002111 [Eretmocerus hayati]|uniref:Uncharacterized protein n=1 Tax=Eretmocerus hayati TaxID=131215 RepID=A0ACC2NIC1_9HYME|nr:hypothetical protein QAD02_002111 [Eretmocerus hayati]